MGLPGSGKTTLCLKLIEHLNLIYLNADELRDNVFTDLRFSKEDRIKNAQRHAFLALIAHRAKLSSLHDLVCPLREMRSILAPDLIIFVNTISHGRFEDTNQLFETPTPGESENFIEVTEHIKFNSLEFDELLLKIITIVHHIDK